MTKHTDPQSSHPDEIKSLIDRIKSRSLNENDWLLVEKLLTSFLSFISILERKNLTIKRLRKMLFGPGDDSRMQPSTTTSPTDADLTASSETETNSTASPSEDRAKPKARDKAPGHGRRPSHDYTGAEVHSCQHHQLIVGDNCPHSFCNGHLYDTKAPTRPIRLTGHPPITATVYQQQVLRCSSCQDRFTAPLPEGVGEDKWDATADVALVMSRYAAGVPFYRTASLQQMVGVPVASSTQFDRCEQVANALLPVYTEMVKEASKSELIHADDTRVKILSMVKQNKGLSKGKRRGMQTTAVVAIAEECRIAIYVSGRRHAGENIKELIKSRPESLGLIKQVGDASANNQINEEDVIFICCWAHARRYFTDIESRFAQGSGYVLDRIAELYKNDKDTIGMLPKQRLGYHQQHSEKIVNQLYEYIEEEIKQKRVEPNSALGKAYEYMRNNKGCLTKFLEQEGVPLDNNCAERALKKTVLMRKNSLFYKTEHGAVIGDMLMSVIETCRLNKVNVWEYLVEVVKHRREVRKNAREWLPWRYQSAGVAAEAA
jgi:transposase